MSGRTLPTHEILDILTRTPQRIAGLTAGLPPALLHTPPGPGEWSANDVLAHLRSCADVWGGCIDRILAEDEPTLRAVDPRTHMRQTGYPELDFQPSLEAYTAQRRALLAVLASLPPHAWSRDALATGAGKPLIRTVHAYAQWMAVHERPHTRQIERTVAALTAPTRANPDHADR
jgi:hypothetical protein